MALSLKNTFLEFQGLSDFGVPSAARRSVSASASVSSGARTSDAPVMCVQLERLSQAIQPAAPLSAHLEALNTTIAATDGMRRLQRRMEETTSAPALADLSPKSHARWADEPSDDESSGYASTRVPADSDESSAFTRPTIKKGNSTIKKGKSKDYRDEQFQNRQDCAMWNHWAFQGQWAPQYDGAWEAQQPSWRW
jgi:hypothetical protein